MKLKAFEFTPFITEFSFDNLINKLKSHVDSESELTSKKVYYQDLLERLSVCPDLGYGIREEKMIEQYRDIITELLELVFPKLLTENEIKAVSLPFQNYMFNYSTRFQKIIVDAGGHYDGEIRNFDQKLYYVSCCCIIMNKMFGCNFDLSKPLFLDIPDAKGIIRHYRVLYNADFVDIEATATAKMLSKEEIKMLEDNYENLALWQEMFPQESWILKGFGICSLVDVTEENALSLLKENMLKAELQKLPVGYSIREIFSSIFKVPNLSVGFTPVENNEILHFETRELMAFDSLLWSDEKMDMVLTDEARQCLFEKFEYYTISDIESGCQEDPTNEMLQNLYNTGMRSVLLCPVVLPSGQVEGVLELGSTTSRALTSLSVHKLDKVMPLINETFGRVKSDLLNHVEAIIQREFTTIHPSVYWRFLEEAKRNYLETLVQNSYVVDPIVFPTVFPLYGEIDIKGSSMLRNQVIVKDLTLQIDHLLTLFSTCSLDRTFSARMQKKLKEYHNLIATGFYSGLEHQAQQYIHNEIHPFLLKYEDHFDMPVLTSYRSFIDFNLQIYYRYRKLFDKQIIRMNQDFATVLDRRQELAQAKYPHYYERFKTDGVEHNIYIGASICPEKPFEMKYLTYMRLWQLQVMVELMCLHYNANKLDEIKVEVTDLVFVYDVSLGIQFKMDEKRFDVDGSYNTRYEVIKKRLDKARIQDTDTRIVQQRKLTIVCVSQRDLLEYKQMIHYFQSIGLLQNDLQDFVVEDLQSVSGLVGFNLSVNLDFDITRLDYDYLFDDFVKSLYL